MHIKSWAGRNKRFIELSVLDSVMWMSMASFIYITIFLKNVGLSTSSIGILLSVGAIFSIVTQPLWGSLCDGALGTRNTMLITIIISGASTLMMMLVKNTVLIMVIYIVRAVSLAPVMMLFDNYVVSECKESDGRMNYGSIRIWGSICFAITAAALGWLTDGFGLEIAFYVQTALSFMLLWLIVKIVRNDPDGKAHENSAKKKWFDKNIFNAPFVSILVFIFLVTLSSSALDSFFPIIFQTTGGSLNMLGLSSSIRAIVEVPFFLSTANLIKRFGSRKLLLIAVGFTAMRILGFAFFSEPLHLLLVNLFGAPAYCLFTAGMLHYVYEISPAGSKTTAQLIVSSIGLSLARVISSSIGGFVLESYGVKKMALGGLAIVIFAIFTVIMQKRLRALSK